MKQSLLLAAILIVLSWMNGAEVSATPLGSPQTEITHLLPASTQVRASPFVVNSAGDAGDFKLDDATCETTTAGECTLRAAIEQANFSGGGDIYFSFGGSLLTIAPQTLLPTINVPVTIDGRTHSKAECQSDLDEVHSLWVVIDGSNIGSDSGLSFGSNSDNSAVYGLVIGNFNRFGIELDNSDNFILACSHVGIDAAGTSAMPTGYGGIYIYQSAAVQIGLGTDADRNVISGNGTGSSVGGRRAGIHIDGDAPGTLIRRNIIGANAYGTAAVPNYEGIYVDGFTTSSVTPWATIGGSSDEANLISGNERSAIVLASQTTEVEDNIIGTRWNGSTALGNHRGILIFASSDNNIIKDNLISGNDSGVSISSGSSATLQNNKIGVNRFGSATVIGSGTTGVSVAGSAIIEQNNVIAGFVLQQVSVSGIATIENNKLGVNLLGTAALPGGSGIRIDERSDLDLLNNTIIGGVDSPDVMLVCDDPAWCAPDVGNNDITPNNRSHEDVLITGNMIGAIAAGPIAGNQPAVLFSNASSATLENNTIMALDAASSIELERGVAWGGTTGNYGGAHNNVIHNNNIGVTEAGVVLGNSAVAVTIGPDNSGNLLDGNVIVGSEQAVALYGDGNTVSDNVLGTTGTARGGDTVGIFVGDVAQSVISGNAVGSNLSLSSGLGSTVGIHLSGSVSNTVSGNTIGLNGTGVLIDSAETNTLHSNAIDTNTQQGIRITAGSTDNVIGSETESEFNQIHNNGSQGILVADVSVGISRKNSFYGNEFSSNGQLAIDLANDGVTLNDNASCDADEGQNDLQNFPTLTGITTGGGIEGEIKSRPSRTYRVDVYTSPTCDASGHGEGAQYFGTTVLALGVSGEATFTVNQLAADSPLAYYSAIATDLVTGNTSEFSSCYSTGVPTAIALSEQVIGDRLQVGVQIGLLIVIAGLTLLALRNRRLGMMLLIIMFIVMGASFAPIEGVTPLISAASTGSGQAASTGSGQAAPEDVLSCGTFGDLLEDGSSAQSGAGIVVGAVAGTLAGPVRISALVAATPEPAYSGPASVVSDYYQLSAEFTVIGSADKPFIVGIPVPNGYSDNMAVAVLQSGDAVLDAGTSGFVWDHALGTYDSVSNLLTFTVNRLSAENLIFAIVHDPSIEMLDPPPSSRDTAPRDVQTVAFEVRCMFLPTCSPAVKQAYEAQLLAAYTNFNQEGFRDPHLKSSTAYFDTSGVLPVPLLSPLNTYTGIVLTFPSLCTNYVGQYNPNTMRLEICTSALPITTAIHRTIRHELFHAVQYAYPAAWSGASGRRNWTIEGTASAAETSFTHMSRSEDFDWQQITERLTDEGEPALNEYEAQDFWVHTGQATNQTLGYLHTVFESGFAPGPVNTGLNGMLADHYHDYVFNNAYEKEINYNGTLTNICAPQFANPFIVPNWSSLVYDKPMHTDLRLDNQTLPPLASAVYEIEFNDSTNNVDFWVNEFNTEDLAWKIYMPNEDCDAVSVGNRDNQQMNTGEKAYFVVSNGSYRQSSTYEVRVRSDEGE